MSDLLHPFTFEFFRQAFTVSILAGALCALVGTFIVVRGMAYLGHGLACRLRRVRPEAPPGVNVVAGAAVWGIVVALLIGRVSRRRIVTTDDLDRRPDPGVVRPRPGLSSGDWPPRRPRRVLFGDVLGVSRPRSARGGAGDARRDRARGGPLPQASSPSASTPRSRVRQGSTCAARARSCSVSWAVAVLAAMNVMGATLVAAGVVIPATARLLTHRFSRMLGCRRCSALPAGPSASPCSASHTWTSRRDR